MNKKVQSSPPCVLQGPSSSYSSSFNFSFLSIIIPQVLVSIPQFHFFVITRFSPLLRSRYLCSIMNMFQLYFRKKLSDVPTWPTSHTLKPVIFPSPPLRYFFLSYFCKPSAALPSLPALPTSTRSVALMCFTPTSYLTVLFLDPLSRPGSKAAVMRLVSASPLEMQNKVAEGLKILEPKVSPIFAVRPCVAEKNTDEIQDVFCFLNDIASGPTWQ